MICSSLHLLHNRTPLAAEASINIQPHTVKSFGTQPSLQCCGSRGQSSWSTWELFAAAAAQEGIGPIEEQPLNVDDDDDNDDDTGNGNLAQHWQKTKRDYSDGGEYLNSDVEIHSHVCKRIIMSAGRSSFVKLGRMEDFFLYHGF